MFTFNILKQKIQKTKIGIYWFMPILYFFRGAAPFSALLLYIVWSFSTCKTVVKHLTQKGYKLKSVDEGKPIEFIEQKVGFTLPKISD